MRSSGVRVLACSLSRFPESRPTWGRQAVEERHLQIVVIHCGDQVRPTGEGDALPSTLWSVSTLSGSAPGFGSRWPLAIEASAQQFRPREKGSAGFWVGLAPGRTSAFMRKARRDSEIAEIRRPPSARACDGRGSRIACDAGRRRRADLLCVLNISSSSAHERGVGAACGRAHVAQARAARHEAGSRDAGTNRLPWNTRP
jgi:hypothetical protein